MALLGIIRRWNLRDHVPSKAWAIQSDHGRLG